MSDDFFGEGGANQLLFISERKTPATLQRAWDEFVQVKQDGVHVEHTCICTTDMHTYAVEGCRCNNWSQEGNPRPNTAWVLEVYRNTSTYYNMQVGLETLLIMASILRRLAKSIFEGATYALAMLLNLKGFYKPHGYKNGKVMVMVIIIPLPPIYFVHTR